MSEITIIILHKEKNKSYSLSLDINTKIVEIMNEMKSLLALNNNQDISFKLHDEILLPNKTLIECQLSKGSTIEMYIKTVGGKSYKKEVFQ